MKELKDFYIEWDTDVNDQKLGHKAVGYCPDCDYFVELFDNFEGLDSARLRLRKLLVEHRFKNCPNN